MPYAQNLPDHSHHAGLWARLNAAIWRTPRLADFFEPLIQKVNPCFVAGKIAARVLKVRHENAQVYSLILKPGRAFRGFVAGQYVELSVERDGRRFSRFFSISSGVSQWQQHGTLELSIRVQEKGQITPWLRQALNSGSTVHLSQAQGDFTLTNPASHLLLIAGGSGITPFRSMLASLHNTQQPVTLLYYAQDARSHLFRDEFMALQAASQHLQVVLIDSAQDGFFCPQHLEKHCPDFARRDIYICGPAPMILHGRQLLGDLGVPETRVHYEFFGPTPVQLDTAAQAGVTEFRRSQKQIINPEAQQTLLEMAETAGLKPASGCRMGVCYQCICKKQSGVVFNTKTGQYSDTGKQDVQLCISVPVGDVVLDI